MALRKLFFSMSLLISYPSIGGITPVSLSNNIVGGYTDKIFYDPGDTVRVFVNASGTFTNYRMYLNDVILSKVDSLNVNIAPQTIVNTLPWTNGYGYSQSFIYVIPGALP